MLTTVVLLLFFGVYLTVVRLCTNTRNRFEAEWSTFTIQETSSLTWQDIENELNCCHDDENNNRCSDHERICENILLNMFIAKLDRLLLYSHLMLPNLVVSTLMCCIILAAYPKYSTIQFRPSINCCRRHRHLRVLIDEQTQTIT